MWAAGVCVCACACARERERERQMFGGELCGHSPSTLPGVCGGDFLPGISTNAAFQNA